MKEVLHEQRFLNIQKKISASKNQKGCNFSHTQDSKMFHIPKIIRTEKMLLNLFHDTSIFHTPLKT